MSIGNSPEVLRQLIVVGIILVGRLGVCSLHWFPIYIFGHCIYIRVRRILLHVTCVHAHGYVHAYVHVYVYVYIWIYHNTTTNDNNNNNDNNDNNNDNNNYNNYNNNNNTLWSSDALPASILVQVQVSENPALFLVGDGGLSERRSPPGAGLWISLSISRCFFVLSWYVVSLCQISRSWFSC